KALKDGITDPNELRKIIGASRIADVYRNLDKLAIRKEYHQALVDNGIDFNFITRGIKELAEGGDTDKVKLASFQTLLKSIGLDKYEKQEEMSKGWEDELLEASKRNKERLQEIEDNKLDGVDKKDSSIKIEDHKSDVKKNNSIETEEYEVDVPIVPHDEKIKEEEERNFGKELYGE
ncbi:MAG: hypothetical protein KAR08_05090, partial [Candidatus Heimdallarchaeota archaeon]|nr:hypothetical protein [Candidatus Heimdallarchaeota archaeon]